MKSDIFFKILITLILIVAIVLGISTGLYFYNKTSSQENDSSIDYLEKNKSGEIREISTEEITDYMLDSNGNILKIAYSHLGEDITYSLKFTCDIPEGELSSTSHLVTGYITTILINGYPNVSYTDMGLTTEEEAYLATQLAIFEVVQEREIYKLDETFSLDGISASKDEYSDMVNRIVSKAKELVTLGLDSPYVDVSNITINTDSTTLTSNNGEWLAGPYIVTTTTDDATIKLLGDSNVFTNDISLSNCAGNSAAILVDENGNELESVENSQPFYIKITGADEFFYQVKIGGNTNYLSSQIYSESTTSAKYVVLQVKNITYLDIYYIKRNVDTGSAIVNFYSDYEDNIDSFCYYIYDENGNLIQDIDWYKEDSTMLPTGKYYIEVYYKPDGYFLEFKKYEFEITKDERINLDIYVDAIA